MYQILGGWHICAAALLAAAFSATPLRAAGPGVAGRVLALDASGRIAGVVPGALIEIEDRSGKVAASVSADKNGAYRLDLKPGIYLYRVRAEGFKEESGGRGISLNLSEGYASYDFSLIPGKSAPKSKVPQSSAPLASLRGQVFENAGGDKLTAIPNATITLRNEKANPQLTQTISAGIGGKTPGEYEVALEPGSYRVSAAAPGFETAKLAQSITVGSENTTRNFTLVRLKPKQVADQGIQGTIASAQGTPQARVTIRSLARPGELPERLELDAKGHFRSNLPAGNYEIAASAPGYRTATSGMKVVLGGRSTVVDFELVKEVRFAGTVYGGLPGASGKKPLPGASVLLRRDGEDLSKALRGTTDAEGKIRLQPNAVGSYVLLVSMKGYRSVGQKLVIQATAENKAEIVLLNDDSSTSASSGFHLNVRAVERVGEIDHPIEGGKIAVSQKDGEVASGVSGKDGLFKAFKLPAGSYQLAVSRPGYQTDQSTVAATDGDINRTVVLKRIAAAKPGRVTLALRVVDKVGEIARPLEGSKVVITQKDREVASGKSAKDGFFKVPNLSAGAYQLEISRAGYQALQSSVTLADKDVNHDAVLKPLSKTGAGKIGAVALRIVVDASDPLLPLPNVQIVAFQNGKAAASGKSGSDGLYSPAGLSPGTYQLECSLAGFQTAKSDLIVGDKDVSRDVHLKKEPKPESKLNLRIVEAGSNPVHPLAGAQIVIAQKGKSVASGKSGTDGHYQPAIVAAGIYQVEISLAGHQTVQTSITIADQGISRDIAVKPTKN